MKKSSKKSENIFDELGFNSAEARSLKIRSELMIAIKKYIKENNLTQAQAAKVMGVDQPRINKLLSGQIELFTIDKLITMLERAGVHVSLNIAA